MRSGMLCVMALVGLAGALVMAPGSARAEDCLIPAPVKESSFTIRFSDGRLAAVDCHIDVLSQGVTTNSLVFDEVAARTAEITRLYQARGRQQQGWSDTAAAGVFISGTAWLASSGAGQYTLQYLGGATLLPILISQFNANEPTSDLFQAGALGMGMISARYSDFHQAGLLLQQWTNQVQSMSACDALRSLYETDRGWTKAADTDLVLGAANEILTSCDRAMVRQKAMKGLVAAWQAWDERLPTLYGRDVLQFNQAIRQRDYALRYGPVETFSALLNSPFNLAGKLLTGDDGAKAVKALKVQDGFTSLSMNLAPMTLPSVPAYAYAPVELASSVIAVAKVPRPGAAAPTQPQVQEMVRALQAADDEVDAFNSDRAYAAILADSLQAAMTTAQLRFTYTPDTRMVQATLGAPQAPAKVAQ